MSTISELAELAELRVYQAVFTPDHNISVRLNVRLFSVAETELILKRAAADPVNLMAESFLDPNTGEKVLRYLRIDPRFVMKYPAMAEIDAPKKSTIKSSIVSRSASLPRSGVSLPEIAEPSANFCIFI